MHTQEVPDWMVDATNIPKAEALQTLAHRLPDGWNIQIDIERGAGSVTLYAPEDTMYEIDTGGESIEADMLEADAPAVPQEPVAWFAFADNNGPVPLELYGRDEKACKHAVLTNARSVGWKGTVEGYLMQMGWTLEPLYAAPQQRPRLTDAEILTLWAQTYVERGASGIEFARAIEKKVRGEA